MIRGRPYLILAALALACQTPPASENGAPGQGGELDSLLVESVQMERETDCHYDGKRYSNGGVKEQDGVLKKCVRGFWRNVDGFGNLVLEDVPGASLLADSLATADSLAELERQPGGAATQPVRPGVRGAQPDTTRS